MSAHGQAPPFTVATVCLNAEADMARALDSVLAQSLTDYEFVVQDGGSTDSTLRILREYESRFEGRLSWVSAPDAGLYDAMNKALERATGEFIVFLGADDRLAPDALETVERILAETPADIVCGATRVVGDGMAWDESPRSFAEHRIPKRAPARHQSIFVRREAIRALGGFSLDFPIAADYDLYLRLKEGGATEVLTRRTLSEFGLGGVSSRNAAQTAEDYRAVRVAHGANPALQRVVAVKSVFAVSVMRVWLRLTKRNGEPS